MFRKVSILLLSTSTAEGLLPFKKVLHNISSSTSQGGCRSILEGICNEFDAEFKPFYTAHCNNNNNINTQSNDPTQDSIIKRDSILARYCKDPNDVVPYVNILMKVFADCNRLEDLRFIFTIAIQELPIVPEELFQIYFLAMCRFDTFNEDELTNLLLLVDTFGITLSLTSRLCIMELSLRLGCDPKQFWPLIESELMEDYSKTTVKKHQKKEVENRHILVERKLMDLFSTALVAHHDSSWILSLLYCFRSIGTHTSSGAHARMCEHALRLCINNTSVSAVQIREILQVFLGSSGPNKTSITEVAIYRIFARCVACMDYDSAVEIERMLLSLVSRCTEEGELCSNSNTSKNNNSNNENDINHNNSKKEKGHKNTNSSLLKAVDSAHPYITACLIDILAKTGKYTEALTLLEERSLPLFLSAINHCPLVVMASTSTISNTVGGSSSSSSNSGGVQVELMASFPCWTLVQRIAQEGVEAIDDCYYFLEKRRSEAIDVGGVMGERDNDNSNNSKIESTDVSEAVPGEEIKESSSNSKETNELIANTTAINSSSLMSNNNNIFLITERSLNVIVAACSAAKDIYRSVECIDSFKPVFGVSPSVSSFRYLLESIQPPYSYGNNTNTVGYLHKRIIAVMVKVGVTPDYECLRIMLKQACDFQHQEESLSSMSAAMWVIHLNDVFNVPICPALTAQVLMGRIMATSDVISAKILLGVIRKTSVQKGYPVIEQRYIDRFIRSFEVDLGDKSHWKREGKYN